MKYYILYNGKVWLSDTKMLPKLIGLNEDYAKSEALKYHYQELYSRWKQNLKHCYIDEIELEKVKNKVYTFDNCKSDNPIDVTDFIDSTFDKEHGIDIYFFKEPIEKCDCGYMADEKGICTECNLPKSFGNTEQVECCKRNEKGVKMCTLKCCKKSEDSKKVQLNEKEQIIKWITQRIKDEQRKHSSHDENWQEIAARKIYSSYNITLKND